MTEDEASATQCCGPEGCGYFNEQPRPARWCVGSYCMAWRWASARRMATASLEILPREPDEQGFCGLAGRPA